MLALLLLGASVFHKHMSSFMCFVFNIYLKFIIMYAFVPYMHLEKTQILCCLTNRARKMKERLGLTEVRKAANRMNFGEVSQ